MRGPPRIRLQSLACPSPQKAKAARFGCLYLPGVAFANETRAVRRNHALRAMHLSCMQFKYHPFDLMHHLKSGTSNQLPPLNHQMCNCLRIRPVVFSCHQANSSHAGNQNPPPRLPRLRLSLHTSRRSPAFARIPFVEADSLRPDHNHPRSLRIGRRRRPPPATQRPARAPHRWPK